MIQWLPRAQMRRLVICQSAAHGWQRHLLRAPECNGVLLLGRRSHLQLMVQHIAAVVYYQSPQDTLHDNYIGGRNKAADS